MILIDSAPIIRETSTPASLSNAIATEWRVPPPPISPSQWSQSLTPSILPGEHGHRLGVLAAVSEVNIITIVKEDERCNCISQGGEDASGLQSTRDWTGSWCSKQGGKCFKLVSKLCFHLLTTIVAIYVTK